VLVASFALGGECIAHPSASDSAAPAYIETGIRGVALTNAKSGEHFLEKNGIGTTSDDGLVHIFYSNTSGSEILDLVRHPGDVRDSFSEMTILSSDCFPLGTPETANKEFVSSKGVKLGLRTSEVRQVLGKPHEVRTGKSGRTKYKYSCNDPAKCPSLARYNLPTYTAIAEFLRGRLVRYSFGYDYP